MKDLMFLSGAFFDTEIPKDQQFLLKYFKTDLQRAFLRYYLAVEVVINFVDHTGYYCSDRYLWQQQARLLNVLDAHKQAKENFDLDLVWKIESGKYKCSKKIGDI